MLPYFIWYGVRNMLLNALLVILILSVIFFGVKRTITTAGVLAVFFLVVSFLGTIFIALLPFIIGGYIFFLLFGRRMFEKKYRDEKDAFEKTFRFYYYSSGNSDRGYSGYRNSYTNDLGGYDGRKYYDILGVKQGAGTDEIKTAYKRLVKQYHPDLHGDKSEMERKQYEAKFKEINEAYEEIKKREG